MPIDQIAVLLVFIGVCIGGAYLIKKASTELFKEIELDFDEKDNINK